MVSEVEGKSRKSNQVQTDGMDDGKKGKAITWDRVVWGLRYQGQSCGKDGKAQVWPYLWLAGMCCG